MTQYQIIPRLLFSPLVQHNLSGILLEQSSLGTTSLPYCGVSTKQINICPIVSVFRTTDPFLPLTSFELCMPTHGECPTTSPSQDLISILPEELLSEILSRATWAHNDDLGRYRYPSTLCKVSRQWRAVALASPGIWSFIFIKAPLDLSHLQSRLAKAGGVALDIKIMDPEGKIRPSMVMRLLTPSSTRWSTLHIHVPTIQTYAASFPNILPVLRHIDFMDKGDEFSLNLLLPQLRTMHLIRTWLFWEPPTTFSNLIHFCATSHGDCRSMGMKNLLVRLGCLPSLQVLEFVAPWDFRALDLPEFEGLQSHAVSLPQLRALRIDALYSWEVVILLSLLRAPALRTLMLNIANDRPDSPEWFAMTKLHISFPCLQKLILKDTRIPTKDLEHLLHQMPPIHQLSIMNRHVHHWMGPVLEEILTNPSLAKMTSHLSSIVSMGIGLAELRNIFSRAASSETSRFRNQVTLKIGGLDFKPNDPQLAELGKLRSLVAHVERIYWELWWD